MCRKSAFPTFTSITNILSCRMPLQTTCAQCSKLIRWHSILSEHSARPRSMQEITAAPHQYQIIYHWQRLSHTPTATARRCSTIPATICTRYTHFWRAIVQYNVDNYGSKCAVPVALFVGLGGLFAGFFPNCWCFPTIPRIYGDGKQSFSVFEHIWLQVSCEQWISFQRKHLGVIRAEKMRRTKHPFEAHTSLHSI